ncbi:MAG: OmpA family protein, partial [Bacteroidota bacterium]|nr:OmpA family protein [Candidatus Kapabacteria bacterium]MDW8220581.1 OmpA family protein [Bacteroidota bacterium]
SSVEPLFAWHPVPHMSVYIGGRISAMWGTRLQDFAIVNDPSQSVLFPDSNSVRILADTVRALSNIFLPHLSILAGVSYAVPVDKNETWFIVPELWCSYNVTPLLNNLPDGQSWSVHMLRGALSVRYSPEATRRYLPPAIVRTAETERLSINIIPLALDSIGHESPLLRLRVEEVLSRQVHPVLPYIFFDKYSDTLPSRYVRLSQAQTASFQEHYFVRVGTLDIYHHILNILGRRLRTNPQARIRLIGCASVDEYKNDSSHIMLAERRAEAVMLYLRNVWRIPQHRMAIEVHKFPVNSVKVAQRYSEEEHAEYRRVEIIASDENIMQPVVVDDTVRECTPSAIKLILQVRAKERVKQWRVKIDQGKQRVRVVEGIGDPQAEIVWHPAREQQTVPRSEEALRCNLDIVEENGEGGTATISIPVEQVTFAKKRRSRTDDRERHIDVFRFLMLSRDALEPSLEHERTLRSIVQAQFGERAYVTVIGYTDKRGNPDDNRRLSQARAQAFARALGQSVSAGQHVGNPVVLGLGSTDIYDERTPEARFYSRMVEIRIESLLPLDR